MVKFTVKANPQGQYYFPKEVREELGDKLTLICNARAAVVYSSETSLQVVLDSVHVIIQDLEHRLKLQKKI